MSPITCQPPTWQIRKTSHTCVGHAAGEFVLFSDAHIVHSKSIIHRYFGVFSTQLTYDDVVAVGGRDRCQYRRVHVLDIGIARATNAN